MHILIVNNTVIPALNYGGSERIIWWLGKNLVSLGFKVTYLVAEGSSCPFADVLSYDSEKNLNSQIPNDVDLVHLNFQTQEQLSKPVLLTHHGNFHNQEYFHINTVFVSRNHAQRNQATCYVHNGLDPDDYGTVNFNESRKHLLFLAYAKRPEKNLADSLQIARKSGNVLAVVGGKPKWLNWRPWVSYKGFLGGAEKNRVLRESKALLFPVRWHEPFGIAIIEAMYFGCPVFGTTHGSLPEIVSQSKLGFLSNSISTLINAVQRLDQYDSRYIHEFTREHFSSKLMTQKYIQLYEKIIRGENLNSEEPLNGGNFNPKELLGTIA